MRKAWSEQKLNSYLILWNGFWYSRNVLELQVSVLIIYDSCYIVVVKGYSSVVADFLNHYILKCDGNSRVGVEYKSKVMKFSMKP
jgi:hypothetical protein